MPGTTGFSSRYRRGGPLTTVKRELIQGRGLDIKLEVDGGIDSDTARQAVDAGATVLVAGTAVFRGGPAAYAGNIKALRGGG